MARNEEKALTLFNKWQTFKSEFHSTRSNRRPLLASDCDSLADAEKWRREIVQNLTKKLSAIKNASLGEHRIRELNDEINKLIKQKYYWEIRIRELGGTVPMGKQYYDVEGKELPGAPGYKYFGAAKELPGVRELFQAQEEEDDQEQQNKQKRRLRSDIYKNITPDYYGFRDDDDGVLMRLEAERSKQLIEEELTSKYNSVQRRKLEAEDEDEEFQYLTQLASYSTYAHGLAMTAEDEEKAKKLKEIEEAEQERQRQLALEKSKKELLGMLSFSL
jgi:pre-mRNA-splicing factor ISY1